MYYMHLLWVLTRVTDDTGDVDEMRVLASWCLNKLTKRSTAPVKSGPEGLLTCIVPTFIHILRPTVF